MALTEKTLARVLIPVIVLIVTLCSPADGKNRRVLLIQSFDHPWFDDVFNMMKAAGADLNMEVNRASSKHSRAKAVNITRQAVAGAERVDAILFTPFKRIGVKVLEIANAAEVPIILIDSGIHKNESERAGNPGEKYKYWIGVLRTSNTQAGYDSATVLFNDARRLKKTGSNGKINVIGVTGPYSHAVAYERSEGLLNAVADNPDVNLYQIFYDEHWGADPQSKERFYRMLIRYPETNVIWTADGVITESLLHDAEKHHFQAGKDALVGGIASATNSFLKSVTDGTITGFIGGHRAVGACAMVILYDYFNGVDFSENGSRRFIYTMEHFTPARIDFYFNHYAAGDYNHIDFTKLSKTLNPALRKYNFNAKILLEPQQ